MKPKMSGAAVSCRSLRKQFGDVVAVQRVDLDVSPGEIVCLLGPSGCGKTTVLRLLAGLERLDEGTIDIAGRRVAGPGRHLPPEKRRVGMVFQDYALFPHLTVLQNVAYGLSPESIPDRTPELLAMVGLQGCEHRHPHELSGGQQQRLALARALAPRPEIILLDEPFSNLDQNLRRRLRQEVRAILNTAGVTAIFVTHDQEEALSLADRLAVMWDGRIVQIGSPHEVYGYPATREVAQFLGEANFFPGEATDGTVRCELGSFPAPAWLRGKVDVMFRPEAFQIHPVRDGGNGRIAGVHFFGHDQLVTVRLAGGKLVDVRVVGMDVYRIGQPVALRVCGRPMMFSRN